MRPFNDIWADIGPAAERVGENVNQFVQKLMDRKYLVLDYATSAVVLSSYGDGPDRSVYIVYAGGKLPDRKSIAAMMADIERIAKMENATSVIVEGRLRGWSRFLTDYEQSELNGVSILRKAI